MSQMRDIKCIIVCFVYLHLGRHPFQLSGLWRLRPSPAQEGRTRTSQSINSILFKLRLPRHTSLFWRADACTREIPGPVRTSFVSGGRGDGYETACTDTRRKKSAPHSNTITGSIFGVARASGFFFFFF